MRFHFLEHDALDFSHSNITRWAEIKGHTTQTTLLHEGETGPDPGDYDWLIVMGGTMFAWQEDEYPWLAGEKAYISETIASGKPVLGICFGAQLLAEVLGGEVFLNGCSEIGWRDVSLTEEGKTSFLFQGIPDPFTSFHWHSSHFSLPSGCTRLAQSPPTSNQAFVCDDRPVIGLQFHPEFTTGMVRGYGLNYGHEWKSGPCCEGLETIMEQTEGRPDTYWLMESLLDNMVKWAEQKAR